MPKRELPILVHRNNADLLAAEFDYDDMVALSGHFRLWAIYSPGLSPDFRTELIGYSADFEELAECVGKGWRAAEPSGALPVCQLLLRKARSHSSVIKLEHARYWLGRAQSPKARSSLIRETAHSVSASRPEVVPQNNRLVNIAAWRWLKKAGVRIDPSNLHLLTLAQWGLENDAEGEWPEDLRDAVAMQFDDLARWNSEDLMKWLFENLDWGTPQEQEEDLLDLLKTANNPLHAAEEVLWVIWFMMLQDAA